MIVSFFRNKRVKKKKKNRKNNVSCPCVQNKRILRKSNCVDWNRYSTTFVFIFYFLVRLLYWSVTSHHLRRYIRKCNWQRVIIMSGHDAPTIRDSEWQMNGGVGTHSKRLLDNNYCSRRFNITTTTLKWFCT